jgi:hypothetical protein
MTAFEWALLAAYVIGAVGTLIFNLSIIVGPVTGPLCVLRNAVLWPVFLPELISASRG